MRSFGLPLAVFATLAAPLLAQNCQGSQTRTAPSDPQKTIVVDATGKYPGSYTTVQAGVNKLTDETPNLFIFPGTYTEQVRIPSSVTKLTVQGYTCDTNAYKSNLVTITYAKAQRDLVGNERNLNFHTSTLGIEADQIKLYNLNVANTAGQIRVKGQGVAVYAAGRDHGFYACSFKGYQNTVAADRGRALMHKSQIFGAVDFFFGSKCMLWVQTCDIRVIGKGWITANGNENPTTESEYVFDGVTLFGNPRTTFLGRPWRAYSRCVFQNSDLGRVVDPLGWDTWTEPTDNVFYAEYNNTGLNSNINERAKFSRQLNQAVKIQEILGDSTSAFFYDKTRMN